MAPVNSSEKKNGRTDPDLCIKRSTFKCKENKSTSSGQLTAHQHGSTQRQNYNVNVLEYKCE